MLNLLDPVMSSQFDQRALADMAGGKLGPQVAKDLDRDPHIALDQCPKRVVARTAVEEFERRYAQPLLVDLGRIRRVRARDPSADIGVMAYRPGPCEEFAAAENRLEDEDVRQMHAALKRVVQDEHVARLDLTGEGLPDCGHRRRHRAEMAG